VSKRVKATYDIGHVLRDGRNAFQVKRILGVGGMGEVYLVTDKALGTDCVMKTLRPAALRHKERFVNEAKVLARLGQRNVATVHARGETDEGIPYYLMPYLEGVSLRRLLSRRGALRIDAALNLGIQLFRGLQACHEREVVHRDIKPDNLILAREENAEVLKILDFGIMKLVSDGTDEGMVCTALYAAPEQLVEHVRFVSPSIDVFAGGMVLFEVLTGRHPYAAYGVDEVAAIARRDQVAPKLSAYGGQFPPAVEHIVAATMALDPKARPTAAQVAAALAPIARVLPAAYDTGRMVTAEDFLEKRDEPQAITRAELEAPTDPDGSQPAWMKLLRMHEEVAKTLGLDPATYAREKMPEVFGPTTAGRQGADVPDSLRARPTNSVPSHMLRDGALPVPKGHDPVAFSPTDPASLRPAAGAQRPPPNHSGTLPLARLPLPSAPEASPTPAPAQPGGYRRQSGMTKPMAEPYGTAFRDKVLADAPSREVDPVPAPPMHRVPRGAVVGSVVLGVVLALILSFVALHARGTL
jgi:serine/threonine protein kinase